MRQTPLDSAALIEEVGRSSRTPGAGTLAEADPRKAPTLDAAALNADGKTYDGAKALSWLSEVLTPGKGFSADEVRGMFAEAQERRRGR